MNESINEAAFEQRGQLFNNYNITDVYDTDICIEQSRSKDRFKV